MHDIDGQDHMMLRIPGCREMQIPCTGDALDSVSITLPVDSRIARCASSDTSRCRPTCTLWKLGEGPNGFSSDSPNVTLSVLDGRARETP